MSNPFFERPILNSPYGAPSRHWELDEHGQPTQQIAEKRRKASFITPIPKPRKRSTVQESLVYDEGEGISSREQQYEVTRGINRLRDHLERWRAIPNPGPPVTSR